MLPPSPLSFSLSPFLLQPLLYIIVGAETGLYVLETTGEKRELVQVSKRACTWLYVMDEEGMMISVSGEKGRVGGFWNVWMQFLCIY